MGELRTKYTVGCSSCSICCYLPPDNLLGFVSCDISQNNLILYIKNLLMILHCTKDWCLIGASLHLHMPRWLKVILPYMAKSHIQQKVYAPWANAQK